MSPEHQAPESGRPPQGFWVLRALGTLMALVFVGLGLAAYLTGHVPEASTRHGMAGPLDGPAAVDFGVTLMLMGLMPLAFWARSARGAGWWAALTLGCGLAHLAWSLWG